LLTGKFGETWTFLGQDGSDKVSSNPIQNVKDFDLTNLPNDFQDLHFHVSGLPTDKTIRSAQVRYRIGTNPDITRWYYLNKSVDGLNGNDFDNMTSARGFRIERISNSSEAEIYVEPMGTYQDRPSSYDLVLYYVDTANPIIRSQSTDAFLVSGDPHALTIPIPANNTINDNLRVSSKTLQVNLADIQIVNEDVAGDGKAPGPDGLRDLKIVISNFSTQPGVGVQSYNLVATGVTFADGSAARWTTSTTPPNPTDRYMEQERDAAHSTLTLHVTPDCNLSGKSLTFSAVLSVLAEGKTASVPFTCPVDTSNVGEYVGDAMPSTTELGGVVPWYGQDGTAYGNRGDCHFEVAGLSPASFSQALLSNQYGQVWGTTDPDSNRNDDNLKLTWVTNGSSSIAHFTFPPVRDEAGSSLTLAVQSTSGSWVYKTFPVSATLGFSLLNRAETPGSDSTTVYTPSAFRTALSTPSIGTILVAGGTYTFSDAITFTHPVTIKPVPGSRPVFQFTSLPSSTAGVFNLYSSRVSIEGLKVTFAPGFTWPNMLPSAAVFQMVTGGAASFVGVTIRNMVVDAVPVFLPHYNKDGVFQHNKPIATLFADAGDCGEFSDNVFHGGRVEFRGGSTA
jgi:hypothetical protein